MATHRVSSMMRHRAIKNKLLYPGPMTPRPQMMVKRDGNWRVLPYGVMPDDCFQL